MEDTLNLLLPFIVLIPVMYLFFIRPQQKKIKNHADLISSIEEGDELVLNSGIHGFVADIDDQVIWLEVAEGVELKVSKSSIDSKLSQELEESK